MIDPFTLESRVKDVHQLCFKPHIQIPESSADSFSQEFIVCHNIWFLKITVTFCIYCNNGTRLHSGIIQHT